jgi:Protein of unknown function (DUF1064)
MGQIPKVVSREEWIAAQERGQSRNKYNARSITVDGRKYASQREAEVACDLKNDLRAGNISQLDYQPRFELIPKPHRVTYVADFLVTYPDGRVEAWDVKGVETAVFKIKAKMFRHFYPHIPLVILP